MPPAIVPAGEMQHLALLFGDSRRLRDRFLADLECMGFSIRSAVGLSSAQMQSLRNIRFIAFHVNETVWEQLEIFTRTFGHSQFVDSKVPICLVLRSCDRELDNLVERYLEGLFINVKGIDGPDYAAESILLALDIAHHASSAEAYSPDGFYVRSRIGNGGICALDYQSSVLSAAIRRNDKAAWWHAFEDMLANYAKLCLPLRLTIPTAPAFLSTDIDSLRLQRLLSRQRYGLDAGLTFQFSAGISTFDAFSKINFRALRHLKIETEYAVPHDQAPCFKSLGLSGFDRVILDAAIFRGPEWSKIAEGLFFMFFAALVEVGKKTAVSGPVDKTVLRKLEQIGCVEYLQRGENTVLSMDGLNHIATLNGRMGGKLI